MIMKKIFFLISCLLGSYVFSFADEPDSINTAESELLIWNLSTTDSIFVRVIPVGFIFSGDSTYNSTSRWNSSVYVTGGAKRLRKYISTEPFKKHRFYLNHDADISDTSTSDASIGYGIYRVEFFRR